MLLKDLSDAIAGNFDQIQNLEFRRRVEDLIILARAEIIRRNIDKYRNISSNLLDQINCIPTVKKDISECCTLDLGCEITRSKDKIPSSIRSTISNSNYNYVGTIDGKNSYSYMDIETFELLKNERFFSNKAVYFYVNGYIYIYGDDPMNIRVKAVFNDPREVASLNDCENEEESDCIDNIDIDEDLCDSIMLKVREHLVRNPIQTDLDEVKLEDDQQ
jgi:hypothetical protein